MPSRRRKLFHLHSRRAHEEDQHELDSSESAVLLSQPHSKSSSHHSNMSRPRWVLHIQAQFWRVLMSLGMYFHRLARPRPPKPAFVRTIPSTISGKPGDIDLLFYVPLGYDTQRQLWMNWKPGTIDEESIASGSGGSLFGKGKAKHSNNGHHDRRRSSAAKRWGGYPVVINFHGGGFTLGHPTDDARWCGTVVDECNAIVVSVGYRLAPECPFPTAVEDGVDAVIWLYKHATELGINKDKIALSGFSSGANMAFTVPLRLWDEMMGWPRDNEDPTRPNEARQAALRAKPTASPSSSSSEIFRRPAGGAGGIDILDPNQPAPEIRSTTGKGETVITSKTLQTISDISLRAIVPWYPSTDYTRTRAQRRATCSRKDQELPALFTDLFDSSYLYPPNTISLDSPYLSPGVAPARLLRDALPQDIILNTCEWDMLLDEGNAFRERLVSDEIGKTVYYKMIEGVPHGWDKAPNPLKPTPGVREHYLRACRQLKQIFEDDEVTAGGVGQGWEGHRKSVPVVR